MTAVASPIPSATSTPITADELRQIPLSELIESPWNPRKHFDPARLAEMVDSLKKGQLAPIIVRPTTRLAGGGAARHHVTRYEIGAGHRRFRAAPGAGLTSLLAIVRDLNDVQFLELLTIENKQRDDIAPLDEAAGFRLLMEKAGYDVAKLAARIGLSVKYVYDRLKLLQLIPAAKQLLEKGVITAGHAILLARLSPTDQKRAIGDLEEVTDSGEYSARHASLLLRPDQGADGELPLHDQVKAVSVREFQQAIQEKIRATPERVDPFLFPESVKALEAAKEEKLSVIHITREYRAADEVRDSDEKQKVFGAEAWKRADGVVEEDWRGRKSKSKPCEWSRYGFVVSGRGQGEVFRVCINKQKCKTHWPEHVKRAEMAKKRAKTGATGSDQKRRNAEDAARQHEQQRRDQEAKVAAERARWAKAVPALAQALAAKIKVAPTGASSFLGELVLSLDQPPYNTKKAIADLVPVGRSAEDIVRRVAWCNLLGSLDPWGVQGMVKDFQALGINAAAIVEKVAPKPTPAPAAKSTPKKKGKRA